MPVKRSKNASLEPRVKVWLECRGSFAFGAGICEILQAVEQTGSIKHAARHVGQSYRHVWDRIKAAERAQGVPLVASRLGGKDRCRSHLTDDARGLVEDFLAFRRKMHRIADREYARSFGLQVPASRG